jgi:hypothetical protein
VAVRVSTYMWFVCLIELKSYVGCLNEESETRSTLFCNCNVYFISVHRKSILAVARSWTHRSKTTQEINQGQLIAHVPLVSVLVGQLIAHVLLVSVLVAMETRLVSNLMLQLLLRMSL